MATATNHSKVLYIAKEDLKKKFKPPNVGLHRIRVCTNSIAHVCSVEINTEEKDNGTVCFKIVADNPSMATNAAQYIQGEFCHETAIRKYKEPDLPARTIRGIKGSDEAKKELSAEDQRTLQAEGSNVLLSVENVEKHDIKHATGPCQLRQFGCGPCVHSWWRIVPVSKPVSKCKKCHIRYDALERNREFGIGRYSCTKVNCGRVFFAHCEATDTLRCRKCKTLVNNPYIHPKWRKARPPQESSSRRGKPLNPGADPFVPGQRGNPEPSFEQVSVQLSHMAVFSPDGYPNTSSQPPDPAVLPQLPSSRRLPTNPPDHARRKIFNASKLHVPTGGTVSTFLTQLDEKDEEEVKLDYDREEEGVGACRFECDCGNEYTVLCEMTDTAKCYKCSAHYSPVGWDHPRRLHKETANPHSCSKCEGRGHCPNLSRVQLH